MTNKSELKTKYKEFIRKGKKKEAQKILSQLRGMVKKTPIKKGKSVVKKKQSLKKKESIDNLSEIKGIGKETVEDMKKIYDSIESLKSALREDKVPLRNDVVKRLKKHLF